MTVIVAHDTPDAIRGLLKRWFIEPRANVFVGTLNPRTHEKTIEYIKRNSANVGLLIISNYPNCQGYKIDTIGPTSRKGVEVSGLWLVAEKWEEAAPQASENGGVPTVVEESPLENSPESKQDSPVAPTSPSDSADNSPEIVS
jgi:CRISPR-associated protein Cas2